MAWKECQRLKSSTRLWEATSTSNTVSPTVRPSNSSTIMPPIWEISSKANLAVTDVLASSPIWISYLFVPMKKTAKIPNLQTPQRCFFYFITFTKWNITSGPSPSSCSSSSSGISCLGLKYSHQNSSILKPHLLT